MTDFFFVKFIVAIDVRFAGSSIFQTHSFRWTGQTFGNYSVFLNAQSPPTFPMRGINSNSFRQINLLAFLILFSDLSFQIWSATG